jgi:hypothetical protein
VAGSVTVTPASTSLSYTGPVQVYANSTFTPTATLSSAAPDCQSGQTVVFTLDTNPVTGAAGPYTLESAMTNSAGVATGATISTTNWQLVGHTITVTFNPTANCQGSSGSGPLTVICSGAAAAGWGQYSVPGAGPVEFGFFVTLVPHKTNTYFGSIDLVNDHRWRFDGSVTSLTKTSSTTGTITGTGLLYWWNPKAGRCGGAWVLAAAGVSYTASFSTTSKTSKGTFGITLNYTPTGSQPTPLPNSSPIGLNYGLIWEL